MGNAGNRDIPKQIESARSVFKNAKDILRKQTDKAGGAKCWCLVDMSERLGC